MMETREVWLFRNSFPGVKLPFYPRGGGINCFSPGKTEEHSPQDFCEICWVARGSCIFDFGNIRAEVHAGESIFRLPGERRFKQVSGRENAVIYYVTFDGKSASEIMQSFGYKRGAIPSGKCPVILFDQTNRLSKASILFLANIRIKGYDATGKVCLDSGFKHRLGGCILKHIHIRKGNDSVFDHFRNGKL